MLWQLKQIKGFILTETESTAYKLLHDLTLEPGELVSKVYVTLKKNTDDTQSLQDKNKGRPPRPVRKVRTADTRPDKGGKKKRELKRTALVAQRLGATC